MSPRLRHLWSLSRWHSGSPCRRPFCIRSASLVGVVLAVFSRRLVSFHGVTWAGSTVVGMAMFVLPTGTSGCSLAPSTTGGWFAPADWRTASWRMGSRTDCSQRTSCPPVNGSTGCEGLADTANPGARIPCTHEGDRNCKVCRVLQSASQQAAYLDSGTPRN
jgi:hypothetical protein